MQSLSAPTSSQRAIPLEHVFTKSSLDYATTLMIAGQTSPNNDWGATDLAAAAAAGVTNAGVQCASKCASMPWLYTGCQNTPINRHLVGGISNPCTGGFASAEQMYPALASTPQGLALLRAPARK